ncbi:MAG: hypothetical protein NT128_04340 [Proteobacteria bacterium]|nr:hypothetical protein [Pseudomonadota bacterium]
MCNLRLVLFSFLLIQNIVLATDLEELCFGSEKSSSLNQVVVINSDESPKKSISFSGGSYFSATYNMGFLKGLQEYFKLDEGDITYLGDSSGALVALVAVLGLDADYSINNFLLKMIKETRELPHCGFSQWGKVLKKNLLAVSEDIPKLKDCVHKLANDRLHVSITHFRLFPFPFSNELVSYFHSTDDLIETILTSCHMPWVLGENFFTKWRGKTCVDGGFTNHNPALDENTVRVNPFLWRSPFFLIWHGCFTLHTEEEARRAIGWGYQDAIKNIQYFLDRGFNLKDSSVPLPLEISLPCNEEDGSTAIDVLRKEIHTVWFYGGNIFFSQVRRYLSSAKETVKSVAWSAITIPVKVASLPIKAICLPFKVISFFCGR